MKLPEYTITPLYLGKMTKYEKSMHTYTFDYGVKMQSPYLAFLIQGDGKNILVDTGPKNWEVIKKYHSHVEAEVLPEDHILKVLERKGLKPEDIDFIICTHLHWDHCQNNDCFPGKKVYTQKREVLYALTPLEVHWVTYESPQSGLVPAWISGGNPLVVLDGDAEILPGIEVFLTPGHTPGSQCIRVNTCDGYYLIGGDTINLYENWEGNSKYRHIPAGIHVDLAEYEETFRKLDSIEFKAVIPGHDMKVLEHEVYPYV